MPLKADWPTHLHAMRLRELARVFARCPDGAFGRALELGGGDGYQAGLLLRWARAVVSTDYQPAILAAPPTPGVTYQVCDAERADEVFAPGSFDLVFSSNLLEHVPDPRRALQASLRLLAPGGVAVHVVPGVGWKLAQLLLHYPNLAAVTLQRLTQGAPPPDPLGERPNNAKQPERISRWSLLWPQPHGVSRTNVGELFAFRKRRWLREVEGAGLELLAALPGPVFSGFGFGMDGVRERLERAGVSAETAFVAVRPGEAGPVRGWF